MDSQAIALVIGAGGLLLGVARLIVSVMSYRLDANRNNQPSRDGVRDRQHDAA